MRHRPHAPISLALLAFLPAAAVAIVVAVVVAGAEGEAVVVAGAAVASVAGTRGRREVAHGQQRWLVQGSNESPHPHPTHEKDT
jgi:hypothetical protein